MSAVNPDELEIAPGAAHENLQGAVWATATEEDLRQGLERAFDYRGDVTITRKDGSAVEGYVFDRRPGAGLADSFVRIMPKERPGKIAISFAEIAGLEFTGRDAAAGKSWEAWVRKWRQDRERGDRPGAAG